MKCSFLSNLANHTRDVLKNKLKRKKVGNLICLGKKYFWLFVWLFVCFRWVIVVCFHCVFGLTDKVEETLLQFALVLLCECLCRMRQTLLGSHIKFQPFQIEFQMSDTVRVRHLSVPVSHTAAPAQQEPQGRPAE